MRITKDDVRGADQYYGLFYARPDMVISRMFVLKTANRSEDVLCYDYAEEEWERISMPAFRELMENGSHPGELSAVSETDALWFLEQHQAFNGEGDDAAVEALLREWTEKKEAFREAYGSGWFSKYVETTFYLKGKQYTITPDSIGLDEGEPWDEGFLEYLQGDIGEDLKKLGAKEIRHMGFED